MSDTPTAGQEIFDQLSADTFKKDEPVISEKMLVRLHADMINAFQGRMNRNDALLLLFFSDWRVKNLLLSSSHQNTFNDLFDTMVSKFDSIVNKVAGEPNPLCHVYQRAMDQGWGDETEDPRF